LSAKLDVAGTIRWSNDVDFSPKVLYEESLDLDKGIKCQRKWPKPRKITRLPDDFKSKTSIENEKLIKLLRSLKDV
jgi:hypothetical protein